MESPPAPSRRAVRSYARGEDAQHAVAHLAEHGITATVEEQRHTDKGSGLLLFRGSRVFVDKDQAALATRLLLRMAPTEAPDARNRSSAKADSSAAGGRLFRRLNRPKQTSPVFIIGVAILCAGFATIYGFYKMFAGRTVPVKQTEIFGYTIEQDIDYDGRVDRIIEYTTQHRPMKMIEDRNLDGDMDMITSWEKNRLKKRARDIDLNGLMDETTYFDPDELPHYADIRPDGKGVILERRVYRYDPELDKVVLQKTLRDTDEDGNFDLMIVCDEEGKPASEEKITPDSPENKLPVWVAPPEYDDEEYDPGPARIKVGGGQSGD
jgi:hypothetical protein